MTTTADRDPKFLVLATACLVGTLLACNLTAGRDIRARVDCQGKKRTVECTIKHMQGRQGANVCWDLYFKCANGIEVTGSGFCQSVAAGSTSGYSIPQSQLTNADQCDNAVVSEVRNLKVTPN